MTDDTGTQRAQDNGAFLQSTPQKYTEIERKFKTFLVCLHNGKTCTIQKNQLEK